MTHMNVPTADIIIVLGAMLSLTDSTSLELAQHTKSRATAAGVLATLNPSQHFIFSGGHCVGVRYASSESRLESPNFSFSAFAGAMHFPSESHAMVQYVRLYFGLKFPNVVLEESSSTTQENAEFCSLILRRFPELKAIGLLTNFYHMSRALAIFRSAFPTHALFPIYAEDWCIFDKTHNWVEISQRLNSKAILSLENCGKTLTKRLEGDGNESVGHFTNSS